MKDRFIKSILCIALITLMGSIFAGSSFAEERIGFMQRTWRKILQKIAPKKEEPVSPQPVVKPAPIAEPVPFEKPVIPEEKPKPEEIQKPEKEEQKEPVRKRKPLSERDSEKLIENIRRDLLVFGSRLASFIPQLRKKVDNKGEIYYVYADDVLGEKAFEDLPRSKLEALYVRVRNEANRLQTERITRQLESIRRAQQIQRVTTPPRVPTVTTPPQTPYIPKTPPPPPQPPRR